MSITSYTLEQFDDVTTVRVTSDLAGPVTYHWYLDGVYWGATKSPSRSFQLAEGSQVRVEVLDTVDPAFDPIANAPTGYPAERTLWWVRSLATQVEQYRVEQQKDGGDWAAIAVVHATPKGWSYSLVTDRLEDLAEHAWRIVPVDRAGNEGEPVALPAEKIVRRPDAPRFTATLDEVTGRVTFSEES